MIVVADEITLSGKDFSAKTRMLSSRVAAEKLGCAQDYIGKLCREGKLKGTLVDQVWFVDPASLGEFEEARTVARAARAKVLSAQRKQELSQHSGKSLLPHIGVFFSCLMLGGAVALGPLLFEGIAGGNLSAAIANIPSPFFGTYEDKLPNVSLDSVASALEPLLAANVHVEIQLPQTQPETVATPTQTSTASSSPQRIIVEQGISAATLNTVVQQLAAGKSGAIQFNRDGVFSASSTALVWDPATGRLGVGTPSPRATLEVNGSLRTQTLCIDDVCLTKDQLQQLLQQAKK